MDRAIDLSLSVMFLALVRRAKVFVGGSTVPDGDVVGVGNAVGLSVFAEAISSKSASGKDDLLVRIMV